jgi:hypothetical protein
MHPLCIFGKSALDFRLFLPYRNFGLGTHVPRSFENEAIYPMFKRGYCCRESPAYGEVNMWYNTIPERLC